MPYADEKYLREIVTTYIIEKAEKPICYSRVYHYWKKFRCLSRFFKNELERKKGKVKVIDVGCGLSANLFFLNDDFGKDAILEFHGIDLSLTHIYFCNLRKARTQAKNFTFAVGNAENLALADNSFDILISTEVLEHLRYPDRAAKEFYRILKPDGLVIITTPNQDSLALKLKQLLCLSTKKGNSTLTHSSEAHQARAGYEHISVMGLKGWTKMLAQHNFRVEKISKGSLLFGSSRQDTQRGKIALALLLETLLDRIPLLYNFSEDVIIAARKPAFCPSL